MTRKQFTKVTAGLTDLQLREGLLDFWMDPYEDNHLDALKVLRNILRNGIAGVPVSALSRRGVLSALWKEFPEDWEDKDIHEWARGI